MPKNNCIKLNRVERSRIAEAAAEAAAVTLFIFKLAKMIERKCAQKTAFYVWIHCIIKMRRPHWEKNHTDDQIDGICWTEEKKKREVIQSAHEWKKNGYSLFCFFGSESLDGLWCSISIGSSHKMNNHFATMCVVFMYRYQFKAYTHQIQNG